MITLRKSINREIIPHAKLQFRGGEVHVRLEARANLFGGAIDIVARLTAPADILELLMVTDAVRREYGAAAPVNLICPYLPYARQDRVCAPGEALSLRVMCDLINAQRYDRVEVWDPHSDVAMALLDRAHAVGQEVFVGRLSLSSGTHLVAPDAGAMKKVGAVAKATGLPYVRADKVRDPTTGEITGTVAYSDPIGDGDFLIVDDICDGGRTFIELAKVLRPLTTGRVMLFVTHGIFSQGLGVFEGLIDRVFTANAFPAAGAHPILTEA